MAARVSSRRGSETAAKAPKRRTAKQSGPSEDEIRILAYQLYERRREEGAAGDEATDWIEAERRLSS